LPIEPEVDPFKTRATGIAYLVIVAMMVMLLADQILPRE
jgi:hypothetical protein